MDGLRFEIMNGDSDKQNFTSHTLVAHKSTEQPTFKM